MKISGRLPLVGDELTIEFHVWWTLIALMVQLHVPGAWKLVNLVFNYGQP